MHAPLDFDPYADTIDPPHDEMADLRSRCPVAHTPSGVFIARQDDVRSVLQRVDDFTGSFIASDGFPDDERALINLDEPEHGRLRRVINGAIAAHRTQELEPFVRDLARRYVEHSLDLADNGVVDMVAEFAAPIPVRAVAYALGVPVDDFDRFQTWADELVARLYDRPPAPYSQLHPEFAGYIQGLVDEIREQGGGNRNFLSRLVEAGLSDAAIRTHALHLIIAGNETTRSMLGNTLYRLATISGLLERVRADIGLVPALIEESLRYDSPIQVMGRTSTVAQVIGDERIEPGDHVVVGLASANRDEGVYADPDEFRLDRPSPKDHLAFGGGPHVCPGAFLARLEGAVAMEELLPRVKSLRLAEPGRFDGNPLFWSRAPLTLQLELTRSETGR